MKLMLAQVIDALASFDSEVKASAQQFPEPFSRTEFLLGQNKEPGVLYIATTPSPSSIKTALLTIDPYSGKEHVVIALPKTSGENVVNAIALYESKLSACLGNMREAYFDQHSLQSLCQALAEFVGNPVVAYDSSLLPAAQSIIPRETAIKLFGFPRANREFVLRTIPDWRREYNEDIFARKGARRISDLSQKQQTAACNVLSSSGFNGYIEIFQEYKPITDGEMLALEAAAKIAAMAPYSFEQSNTLTNHLKGSTVHDDLTSSWLETMRWRKDDNVFVIAIDLGSQTDGLKEHIDHIVRMLRLILPGSVSQQMGETPVAVTNCRLISRDKALASVASFVKKLDVHTYVGASETLLGINSLHKGYEHARFSAKHARVCKANTVMRFEQCRFAFFSELCNLNDNEDLVVDERLAKMHLDDIATGSENVRTIETVIKSAFNLNDAADALSVHRNTIAYRLRHIREKYGIDLSNAADDNDLVFQVLLSCMILRRN